MATQVQLQKKSNDYSLLRLTLYFLRLGGTGFGGPIALTGRMQQDLVERRHWIDKEGFLEGLAFSQLAPGPLAAQLAMYLGYLRAGVLGATLAGFAFITPSFLMVLGLSAAYVRYGGLHWMRAAFYGIGASVVAIVFRSAVKLAKISLGQDRLLWTISCILALTTALTGREIVWLFLASGVAALLVRRMIPKHPEAVLMLLWNAGPLFSGKLWDLFTFFTSAGLFVFGSGLAIVPFLHGGVVQEHHWLTEQQFLDAVAIAMVTPGPVVITVAFIGYLVSGPAGALVAAAGVFLPVYFLVALCAPYYKRFARNSEVRAFVQGVTAAATGAIAGAVLVLGRHAIHDLFTLCISLLSFGALLKWKIPEMAIVLASGALGILFYRS